MEQQEGEQGAAVLILVLLDKLWFQLSVLSAPTTVSTAQQGEVGGGREVEEASSSSSPPAVATSTMEEAEAAQERRRKSPAGKMETVLSGKEMVFGSESDGAMEETIPKLSRRRRSKKKQQGEKKSKSLSELEFEEMKGFMDLGFSFSDEEAVDPRLASILPGLQRLRNEEGAVDDPADAAGFRPYLSEAWEYREREDLEIALRRWKLPARGTGGDLRDNLRRWAHTVAWIVR